MADHETARRDAELAARELQEFLVSMHDLLLKKVLAANRRVLSAKMADIDSGKELTADEVKRVALLETPKESSSRSRSLSWKTFNRIRATGLASSPWSLLVLVATLSVLLLPNESSTDKMYSPSVRTVTVSGTA